MKTSRGVAIACVLVAALAESGCHHTPDCGSAAVYDPGTNRCVCPDHGALYCATPETCMCVPADGGVPDDGAWIDAPASCTGAGTMTCGGACVDTTTSADHCGACDTPCAAPSRCVEARCVDPVIDVEVSGYFVCALRASGSVACWGSNASGQLGDGTTIERHTPVVVIGLTDAVEIAAGGTDPLGHGGGGMCARRSTGDIVCWGAPTSDPGSTTPDPSPIPVAVPVIAGARQISVGGSHVCALDGSMQLWCWGANGYRQLGTGSTNDWEDTPARVIGLTDVRQISAGTEHTCAVLGDGTVRCWGYGYGGALGNGHETDSATPVPVTSLTNVAQVESGFQSTCARQVSGQVQCWGSNDYGCLGREGSSSSIPVWSGGTDRDFEVLFPGDTMEVCGRRAGGSIACWGVLYGFGGDSDAGLAPVATAVERSDLAGAVAASASHVVECIVRDDGTVWCRGNNFYGQVGDGTTEARTELTRVVGLP